MALDRPGCSNLVNEVLEEWRLSCAPVSPSVNKAQELNMGHSHTSSTRDSSRILKSLVAGGRQVVGPFCFSSRFGAWVGRIRLTAP